MRSTLLRRLKGIIDGFTLIELVVSMVVAGIIFGVGYMVFKPMVEGFVTARDYSVIYSNGKYALDKISEDIREAVPNTVRVSPDGTAVEFAEMESSGYYTPTSGTDNVTCAGVDPDNGSKAVIYAVKSDWFYNGDSVYTISKYDPATKTCLLDRTVDRGSPYKRIYILKDIAVYYLKDGVIYKNTVSLDNADWQDAENGGEPLVGNVKSLKFQYLNGHTYSMPEVVIDLTVGYADDNLNFFGTARVRNVP